MQANASAAAFLASESSRSVTLLAHPIYLKSDALFAGVYQGWREGWFTNDHWIAFAADSVAPTTAAEEAEGGRGDGRRAAVRVVELKKLGPEKWAVVPSA